MLLLSGMGNAEVKGMKGCGGTWGRIQRISSTGDSLALRSCICTVHLRTCLSCSDIQDAAGKGSRGGFTPVCTAEYLQGTVVGVQSQQMLVCARIWPTFLGD